MHEHHTALNLLEQWQQNNSLTQQEANFACDDIAWHPQEIEEIAAKIKKMDSENDTYEENLTKQLAEIQREESEREPSNTEDSFDADNPEGLYIQEISHPLLKRAEEIKLARRIADGDAEAREKFIICNLRLVVSIAKRYTEQGLSLLDLIQEGNIGLMEAVDRFDLAKGYKFSTYATWWIEQKISRALANQSRTIRISVYMHEKIKSFFTVYYHLHQNLDREPTDNEIAEMMGLDTEKVQELIQYMQEPLSLQTPIGNENEENHLGHYIKDESIPVPEKIVHQTLLKERVAEVVNSLDVRESKIIKLRFGMYDGQPRTLKEVGKIFGVTRERIRQIEDKAMGKLRDSIDKKLKDFL